MIAIAIAITAIIAFIATVMAIIAINSYEKLLIAVIAMKSYNSYVAINDNFQHAAAARAASARRRSGHS